MNVPLENRVSGTCLLLFAWEGAFRPDRIDEVRDAFAGWGRTLRMARERTGKVPDATPARVFLRRSGISPSRYPPSSEALVQRLLDGEVPLSPLPAVDANNLVSATLGAPLGLYDLGTLVPPLVYRKGEAGESMPSMAKGDFDLSARAALFDSDGPFGSAVSDSPRSAIRAETSRWLWIAYGLPGEFTTLDEMLRQAVDTYWNRAGELECVMAEGPG